MTPGIRFLSKKNENVLKQLFFSSKCKNLSDAVGFAFKCAIFAGLRIFKVSVNKNKGSVKRKILPTGLSFYIGMGIFGSYLIQKAFRDDQTIVRSIFDTKLRRYGDGLEKFYITFYIIYIVNKFALDLTSSRVGMQSCLDIENSLAKTSASADLDKFRFIVTMSIITSLFVILTRPLCVSLIFFILDLPMPIEKLLHITFSDISTTFFTSYYCLTLTYLRERFALVNELLREIRDHETWSLLAEKHIGVGEGECDWRDKYTCERVRICGDVYAKLSTGCTVVNEAFGYGLVTSLLLCFMTILLHLFYAMEATATGVYRTPTKYNCLIFYLFLQISFALGTGYLKIYNSVKTKEEASETLLILSDIINKNISQKISLEATYFSAQVKHECAIFTAVGLFEIDYGFILWGVQDLTTFLIVILQFVLPQT